ncbi:hypothetical protein L6R52_33930 [Myxococcota bacterium]|nr:hypothetical protein [Myxococcota bacterium]
MGASTRSSTLTSIVLVLGVAFTAARAEASPWTKNLGQAYFKVGQSFFTSSSFVDANGKVQSGADYLGSETAIYVEAGLWDRLQVIAYLPYKVQVNTFASGDIKAARTRSGGDAMFALQWSPELPIPVATAVRADVKVPLYDSHDLIETIGRGAEGRGGWLERGINSFATAGDGQLDTTLWLSAGGGIPGTPLYTFGELGYQARTSAYVGEGSLIDFKDGLVFRAELGITLFERLSMKVGGSGVVPFGVDETTKAYVAAGGGAYLRLFRGLAIEADVTSMVWARNAGQGLGLGFGVSYAL